MIVKILLDLFSLFSVMLCFYTFSSFLTSRFSDTVCWTIFCITLVIDAVILKLTGRTVLISILSLILLILCLLICFKNTLKEKIIAFIFVYSICGIGDITGSAALMVMGDVNWYQLVITYVIYMSVFIPLAKMFSRIWKDIQINNFSKKMFFLFFAPLWQILMMLIIMLQLAPVVQTGSYDSFVKFVSVSNNLYWIIMLLSELLLIGFYIYLFKSIHKETEKISLDLKYASIKKQNEIDFENYKNFNKTIKSSLNINMI